MSSKWTKDEIKFLIENYPKNVPLTEIMSKINKTKRAIQHKAAREGISRPRFPSDKPSTKQPRKIIEDRYYEKNKKKIYLRKKERNNQFINELRMMLGGKCRICGYSKYMGALDFHHTGKDKEGNIPFLVKDFSKQKSLKEIKKCILLCANCHRELHHRGS